MILDLIMNTVGTVLSMVSDEKLAMLAAVGILLGFLLSSVWIFSMNCNKCQSP